MRALLAGLTILLLLNGALASMRSRLSEERAGLRDRLAEQERSSELSASEATRQQALSLLVERARKKGLPRHLGVGAVRDILVEAQRGLAMERLSLEFRPFEGRTSGATGIQISANMVGSFEGLFSYLDRIESLRLPLAPRALSLQRDATSGSVGLTGRWAALWGAADEPDPNEVAALNAWLDRESTPRPGRDLFSEVRRESVGVPREAIEAPVVEAPEPIQPLGVPDASREVPSLIGFVVARPELEEDVSRRVLAALRYEGEVHLVAVGDRVGVYRVESMQARERVELVDAEAGERVVLELP